MPQENADVPILQAFVSNIFKNFTSRPANCKQSSILHSGLSQFTCCVQCNDPKDKKHCDPMEITGKFIFNFAPFSQSRANLLLFEL